MVRSVFKMDEKSLNTHYDDLGGTLGETLITPTKIYVKALKAVKDAGVTIRGCSHITGGGFYENVPRMLHDGVRADIRKDSYDIPPIFKMLAREGDIDEQVMYNTFNMGIGMVLAVSEAEADAAITALSAAGERVDVIGKVREGEKGIDLR